MRIGRFSMSFERIRTSKLPGRASVNRITLVRRACSLSAFVASLALISGCASTKPKSAARPIVKIASHDSRPSPTSQDTFDREFDSVQLASVVQADISVHHAKQRTVASSEQVDAPESRVHIVSELNPVEMRESPRVVTMEEMETLAISYNPTIQQQIALSNKAAGYRTQVGLRPNPLWGYQGQQLADPGTEQNLLYFEQDFITGEKLRRNTRVLDEAVRTQNFDMQTQIERVKTDTRILFFAALVAQERVKLTNELLALAAQGVEIAEARFAAKEGTKTDILQAKIVRDQVTLSLEQSRIVLQTTWQELIAMIGCPEQDRPQLAGELPADAASLDKNGLRELILSQSPEYHAASAAVVRAQAELDRHLAQNTPNVNLQMGAGHDSQTQSGMMNVQVSTPLFVNNRNQGNIAAAKAEYCRAINEQQRISQSILTRIAVISRDYENALVAATTFSGKILPAAKDSLELAEVAYRAGETSFVQVLVARQTYINAKLDYLTSQGQLAQARVKLDGFVLTGGLDAPIDRSMDDGLRDFSFTQR
jgi:outer membrane protein, heavy metal efflux system